MIVPCDVVDVPDVCCRCLIVPNDRLSSCRCNLCIAVTPLGQEIKSASRLNLRGTSEVNMNSSSIVIGKAPSLSCPLSDNVRWSCSNRDQTVLAIHLHRRQGSNEKLRTMLPSDQRSGKAYTAGVYTLELCKGSQDRGGRRG
jgi:hypothetical protein